MNKLSGLLAALIATSSGAQTSQDLIRALSYCDGRFFRLLAARQTELSAHAAMDVERGHGYFKVKNQRDPVASRVSFGVPINVAGVTLVGYFDEIVNIPDQGIGYSWGFLVKEGVPAALKALRPLTWDAARLRQDGPVHVRSEVWTESRKQEGWVSAVTEAGVPKPGTVERVLLIEPYDGEREFIRYGCSIQGSVTTEMLREIRPDLGQ